MSTLPTVSDFGVWLEMLRQSVSGAALDVAAGAVLLAYARAYARASGLDEHTACLAALEAVRDSHGEALAGFVARAQGLDLAALLDQEREDRLQEERERNEPQEVAP